MVLPLTSLQHQPANAAATKVNDHFMEYRGACPDLIVVACGAYYADCFELGDSPQDEATPSVALVVEVDALLAAA